LEYIPPTAGRAKREAATVVRGKGMMFPIAWKDSDSCSATEPSVHPWLPPTSRKRLLGPALNATRRLLWRVLGLSQTLRQSSQQVLSLQAQLHALNQGQPFLFRPVASDEEVLPPSASETPQNRFLFRPQTTDEGIFHTVVGGDEYRLPEQFGPDDIVLDIGMHIGSCCLAVLLRGAGNVYGFEPDPANYALASRNLAAFGDRCRVSDRAVWRSDRCDEVLHFCSSLMDPSDTGGGNVLYPNGRAVVRTVSLDRVLSEVSEDGRKRVRFLKIDCEGSEFPILLTSRMLHCVDQIHGEYHELNDGIYNHQPIPEPARVPGVDRFSIGVLTDHLRREGFAVEHVRHGKTHLGLFFATRRGQ
jgi:FkbM family methyltransferase